ncbi:MAG: PhnD/SsuA/transferrin family substrate-binding protein [Anaerolineales bacterium]|nr:PhnD/SsuA/transferrin family substrate-binding protein [Anaerolineales bacterium]
MFLAACGGSDATPAPTSGPQLPTSTPRSTPLPEVATPVVLGTAEDPLTLAFVVAELDSGAQDAIDALDTLMTEELANERLAAIGLVPAVEVKSLTTMREGLQAICGPEKALVWVDAFTYIAAEQACDAQPILALNRTANETVEGLPDRVTIRAVQGLTFDIIYRSSLGTLTLADLENKTFCRLGADDLVSWVYPNLTLRGAGINPITGIAGVVDVEDYAAMVSAIQDPRGECQVGAIPRGTLQDIFDALANDDIEINPDAVNTLASEAPAVPYMILVAPPSDVLLADLRQSVVDVLQAENAAEILPELFVYDELDEVTPQTYNSFRQWLQAAGWEMSQ